MEVLERCMFKSRVSDGYLIADAYDGGQIKKCLIDFLSAAAGLASEKVSVSGSSAGLSIVAGGAADLLVYVGHDAFMDFQIPSIAGKKTGQAKADDHPGVRQ